MRDNGLVTGHEVPIKDRDELLRKAHSIVRHPDMPERIAVAAEEQSADLLSQEMVGLTENQLQLVERFD